MKYLDFDLLIEPSGDAYAARVFNSPGGQASANFTAPFSDLEIENFLLRIGRSRHAVRRIESPEMTSAKLFGGRLFDSVFTGDVRGCLRSSMDEANRQGLGLRVRLHLGKSPALADLPWEFLYNVGMNRFLGLSVETPVVRYLELPERIRPLTVKPPLRVLMMISSPTDYPQLDVKREADKMNGALAELEERGLISVERQDVATLAELQHRLRKSEYHIFHFIGHGGFDDQAQDGLLILEDQEERGRRVPAQFLGTLLHDHRPLRLAVLNACEGARASRADPFAGTAQSLVQQGIPAVIAMQFEVTDEAAICFTREFYSAIAVGYPVDAALAEARKAIFAEVSEIEWGTPVLYMRSPDGLIFEMEQVSEADRQKMQTTSLLTAARTAIAGNDEATAADRLKQVLGLDPGNADASALLKGIEDAQAWVRRSEDLRRDAMTAMASEHWDDALEKWQALLASSRDDQDARSQLSETRRQQELARLYARGRSHYELRNWKEARVEFHQLHRIANPYKDVEALVANVERELQKDAQAAARSDAQPGPGASRPEQIQQEKPPVAVAAGGEKKSGRAGSFILGGMLGAVAVAGLLVVAIVVIVSIYGAGSDNALPVNTGDVGGGPVSPPAQPSPAPNQVDKGGAGLPVAPPDPVDPNELVSASPALTAELQRVVAAADQAEIQAYQTLNPAFLQGSYTGDILNSHLLLLNQLRQQGVVMVNTLHSLTVLGASVARNGQRAEMRVTERWSTNFLNAIGQCVSHYHEHDVPQTAYLQRAGPGWLIYGVKQESGEPVMAPCH